MTVFLICMAVALLTFELGMSLAFGAFLARNYGGAPLFQKIVQSALTDETAVVNAVNIINGTTKTFEDLLIDWGKSVLNSEDITYSPGYNKNEFSTSHLATIAIDFKMKLVEINGSKVKMQIWDTAGQ